MSALPQPLKMSGSDRKAREDRAQLLADHFTKFIGEHVELLVQVREDFFAKPKDEAIMGCKTFTEYCVGVLHYSESHIRKLIAGRNPASAKHDGTANRKPSVLKIVPTPVPPAQEPPPELTKHNPVLADKIRNGAVTIRESKDIREPEDHDINLNGDYFRHLGHLLDGVFKGQIKEKLDVLCNLPKTKVTPKIKRDAEAMVEILEDLQDNANKYICKLKKISNARVA